MPECPVTRGDALEPLALVQLQRNLGELELEDDLGLCQVPHDALAHLNLSEQRRE